MTQGGRVHRGKAGPQGAELSSRADAATADGRISPRRFSAPRRRGRPIGVMLLAACLGLAGLALARAAGVPDPARQAELRAMLLQDCGSCHGLTLKGGLGPPLRPEALAGKPRDFLILTIRQGRPGTAMPPWAPILKDGEIAWLVDELLSGRALREGER